MSLLKPASISPAEIHHLSLLVSSVILVCVKEVAHLSDSGMDSGGLECVCACIEGGGGGTSEKEI